MVFILFFCLSTKVKGIHPNYPIPKLQNIWETLLISVVFKFREKWSPDEFEVFVMLYRTHCSLFRYNLENCKVLDIRNCLWVDDFEVVVVLFSTSDLLKILGRVSGGLWQSNIPRKTPPPPCLMMTRREMMRMPRRIGRNRKPRSRGQ